MLRYSTVHDGARLATTLGRGDLLAKINLKNVQDNSCSSGQPSTARSEVAWPGLH